MLNLITLVIQIMIFHMALTSIFGTGALELENLWEIKGKSLYFTLKLIMIRVLMFWYKLLYFSLATNRNNYVKFIILLQCKYILLLSRVMKKIFTFTKLGTFQAFVVEGKSKLSRWRATLFLLWEIIKIHWKWVWCLKVFYHCTKKANIYRKLPKTYNWSLKWFKS